MLTTCEGLMNKVPVLVLVLLCLVFFGVGAVNRLSAPDTEPASVTAE